MSLFALSLASALSWGQMSDSAVAEYVRAGLASGKSQQEMARELASRGVTREQAERIKRSYEESRESEGAARSAGVQESARRDAPSVREMSSSDLDVVTSEVQDVALSSDAAAARLVFGRDIFTNRNLTFAPSANLPTPPNYRLGPGDEVIINIWGTNEATIRQTISPEGTINVQDIGLVNLNGMTVREADAHMRRTLGRIYSVDGADAGSEIKLTLGNVRTIQVNIMGEVAVPGTYYLSSFSNVYHALYRAGGVSKIGSLRDVRLIRGGKRIATFDVYDFILKGEGPEGVTLEEGDVVSVPAYESLVDLSGNVKRPMVYEMREGETLGDLISYAGGFASDAYREGLRLVRRNGREYKVFTVDGDEYGSFALRDGDAVSVGAMLDRFENRIEVRGAVYRPGVYELGEEVFSVRGLILKAEGLRGDAFTNRALLQREREDLTLETVPVDVAAVMAGTAPDIRLRRNDVLYVSSVHDLGDVGAVTVLGEVARPGTFVFAENTSLEDIIMQAGGLLESASEARVDVSRRIKDPLSTEPGDTLARTYSFALKDGLVVDGGPGFALEPYDRVFVRRSPAYREQETVTVTGEVTYPGEFTLTAKDERLSGLVAQAGGASRWAYLRGARLSRQATPGEMARMSAAVEMAGNARDSVDLGNIGVDGRYYVGIDLERALASPGGDADLVLRAGDRLHVPTMVSTVSVRGDVMYPNVVTYDPGMTVGDFVAMAGGYGFRAKRSKAYVVYMNGTVARARRHSRSVVEPGCEIIVPERRKGRDNLQDVLGVATTSASIATMVATIGNIIR